MRDFKYRDVFPNVEGMIQNVGPDTNDGYPLKSISSLPTSTKSIFYSLI